MERLNAQSGRQTVGVEILKTREGPHQKLRAIRRGLSFDDVLMVSYDFRGGLGPNRGSSNVGRRLLAARLAG